MNKKRATKALAMLLSATSIASAGMPAITSSMTAFAASSTIDMQDVQSNLLVTANVNGVDVASSSFNDLLVDINTKFTVTPSTYSSSKFKYQYTVYKPAADGSATTENGTFKSVALQANNYVEIMPTVAGNYTVVVKVVNANTGESVIKNYVCNFKASEKLAAGKVVYDSNGNRYKVLTNTNSSKTLALTGIVAKNNTTGFEFEDETVSAMDTSINGVSIPVEGFKITQFGDGTNPVVRIETKNGVVKELPDNQFREINIPATVKTIAKNSITNKTITGYVQNKVNKDGIIVLGSKKTDKLYISELTTIADGAISNDVLSNVTFVYNHANVYGSVAKSTNSSFGGDVVISGTNGSQHRYKFGWLKTMPANAKLQAPFGSWSWCLMNLLSRFDCTPPSSDTTYTTAAGYGCARKNFVLSSTSAGSLSKGLKDSATGKSMMVGLYLVNNKKATATTTPVYHLVVHNGGDSVSDIPAGGAYVIHKDMFDGTILRRSCDKSTGIMTISPNTQAETGLSKSDKIQFNVMKTYNIGASTSNADIEMLPFSEMGACAITCMPSTSTYDASTKKLTKTVTTYFKDALTFPIYKIKNGSGFVVFKATLTDSSPKYEKDAMGGEGEVKISFTDAPENSLTKYINTAYSYKYFLPTYDNCADGTTYATVNNVSYTRGKWDSSNKKFVANSTGGKLKLNFAAKNYRYYKVQYIDLSKDNADLVTLWDGAKKGVQGFDGGSAQNLLLDSGLNDNKFYEIRITEYADAYKGAGIRVAARVTSFPLIDGRGFLKVFTSIASSDGNNRSYAASEKTELDLGSEGTRYIKYYGDGSTTYKIYEYVKNNKTGVITEKSAVTMYKGTSAIDNTNTASLHRLGTDFNKVGKNELNYRRLKYSNSEIGQAISSYIVIKDTSGNVMKPRVYTSTASPTTVKGKNSSGASVAYDNAMKYVTFAIRGVKLDINTGSSSYFVYNNGTKDVKRSCKAIAPVQNTKTGEVSHNKMKVQINAGSTEGKTIEKASIRVQYCENLKTKNNGKQWSNGVSGATWAYMTSAGAFTNTDTIEITPRTGLVFYRVEYNYVGETTKRYSNIAAVTYNALTSMTTKQTLKYEPISNIGGSETAGSGVYNTFTSTSTDAVKVTSLNNASNYNTSTVTTKSVMTQKDLFGSSTTGVLPNADATSSIDGQKYNPILVAINSARTITHPTSGNNTSSWKVISVPMKNNEGKIIVNNNYTSYPETSSLATVIKNAKNCKVPNGATSTLFDNIVNNKEFVTVTYTNRLYALNYAGVPGEANLNFTKALVLNDGATANNGTDVTFKSSSPLDMSNKSSTITLKKGSDEVKYVALIQTVTVKNPTKSGVAVGSDTKFDGTYTWKSQAKVYLLKLSNMAYEPIAEHKTNLVMKNDSANTDELVVTVKGCKAHSTNKIFKAYFNETGSGGMNKLYNIQIDDTKNLTTTGQNAEKNILSRVTALYNPSKVTLTFKYKTKAGVGKTGTIVVNRVNPCDTSGAGTTASPYVYSVKTAYANGDKTTKSVENDSTYKLTKASRYIMNNGSITAIEYTLPMSVLKTFLKDHDADMSAFKGVIKADVRVYSAGRDTPLTISAGSDYETHVPPMLSTAYKSSVKIDVSAVTDIA